MSKLILTGWSVGYAVPAMIALTKFSTAIAKGVSKRRLPELLFELTESEDSLPEEIVILGISLNGDPNLLGKALRKLKKLGVKVVWISVCPVSFSLAGQAESLFSELIVDENADFCDLIAEYFQVRKNSTDATRLKRLYRPVDKLEPSDKWAIALIDAASFRYRTVQDPTAFSIALKTIAENKPFTEAQHQIINEFDLFNSRELKGQSDWIREARQLVRRVGEEDNCRVLITGETGTGKETVASLIHRYSNRCNNGFVAFNCADLSPQMLESRLFGHEKGSFTGAGRLRQGAFELANGGTLFLDEVAELPLNAQAGLLRVLQEGRFYRLGGEEEVKVDVRILAATNRNLPKMVKEGLFREDLFYRISTISIHVPPLRERLEDLFLVAKDYLISRNFPVLTKKQEIQLREYHWPGNVRELQNILDRANILGEKDYEKIIKQHKSMMQVNEKSSDLTLATAIKRHAEAVLEKYEGNKTHASNALGITVNTLKKYIN